MCKHTFVMLHLGGTVGYSIKDYEYYNIQAKSSSRVDCEMMQSLIHACSGVSANVIALTGL